MARTCAANVDASYNYMILKVDLIVELQDMVDLVKEYEADGIRVDGIGCQGHTKDYVFPHATGIWVNLYFMHCYRRMSLFLLV